MYRLLTGILLVVAFQVASANEREMYQNRIYQAFVSGDMNVWERTIDAMERYYARAPLPDMLYDLLLARYGFIAVCLDKEDKAKAREQLDKADAELEKLLVYNAFLSRARALEGALLGFRISLRPLSAIRLGPRSYRAIDLALELDPENPTAWMEKGNSRFYTPSTFGGSKEEARDAYLEAVRLFEINLPNNQRWLYLNSLVGLAKSYAYTGQEDLGLATYRKVLKFEPDFTWVKEELLPQAEKRAGQ